MTTRDWIESEVFVKGLGIRDVGKWEMDQVWMNRSDAYKASRVLADSVSSLPLFVSLGELSGETENREGKLISRCCEKKRSREELK